MPLASEEQSLEAKGRQETRKLQFSFFLRYITFWIAELPLLLHSYYCYLLESCHYPQTAFTSPFSRADFADTHMPVQYSQTRNEHSHNNIEHSHIPVLSSQTLRSDERPRLDFLWMSKLLNVTLNLVKPKGIHSFLGIANKDLSSS